MEPIKNAIPIVILTQLNILLAIILFNIKIRLAPVTILNNGVKTNKNPDFILYNIK
jgi:regulatory protein YycI of two-component signal transduction system YycFG